MPLKMPFTQWIPWKFLVKRTARAYGIIDPVNLMAQVRRFSQPSEVQEPIELLRAGIQFHARGLINTKAIQHNLDWVWPFWVERQFNPKDVSFIPRAFSFSHVNLTHRNWTAVGQPFAPLYPIVDPRGLVTPLFDGWSIDCWIIPENGEPLLPSRLEEAEQMWDIRENPTVRTRCLQDGRRMISAARVEVCDGTPCLVLTAKAESPDPAWLAIALRPYNPEGIQFIEKIEYEDQEAGPGWIVDEKIHIHLSEVPERLRFSNYEEGDVLHRLGGDHAFRRHSVECDVGMATSAAIYSVAGDGIREVSLRVPLTGEEVRSRFTAQPPPSSKTWSSALSGAAELEIPDPKIRFLYDAALRSLILLSAKDVVPGPYTYRRFWFRDACFMLNGILAVNLTERAERILSTFPARQRRSGYFRSQTGEWDSNGQTLWIIDRYQQLTGDRLGKEWLDAVVSGAEWIKRKRIRNGDGLPHDGLLPPGFSAEHFGPNDYYYWDDFWGVAGLKSAARLVSIFGSERGSLQILKEALDFERSIFKSISTIPDKRCRGGIPAAPYRRMDAGAIGSLVADYPLRLTPAGYPRIMKTAEFLMEFCFQQGGFFQDMIHSGINAYLTLDIAQTLLRSGDPRYRDLIRTVADFASPTGQWPEAIHPLTRGGCMGDGHHGWAAAEWVVMIRNLFVREEDEGLIFGSGIFPEWLEASANEREEADGRQVCFGPTPTPYGPVSLFIERENGSLFLKVSATWREEPPSMSAKVPGCKPFEITDTNQRYLLEPDHGTGAQNLKTEPE